MRGSVREVFMPLKMYGWLGIKVHAFIDLGLL
jgi:hypothetical protein